MTIPNNLKFYRQKASVSQAQLSKMVGLVERHYQNIEYGNCEPGVYTARRLASALGVEVKDLFPLPTETSPQENTQQDNTT